MSVYKKHGVIPDCQLRPGVPNAHMGWAGQYLAEKRPDVLILLGDVYDLPSLSGYDLSDNPGEFHQRRYEMDLLAGDMGIDLLEHGLAQARRWRPRKVYLVGNHEDRYSRLIKSDPRLAPVEGGAGSLRAPWDHARARGWEIVPFLKPEVIDGIAYCHYFCRGPSGTVTNSRNGSPSAKVMVAREMMSCTAGHKQGLDVSITPTSHGMMRGVIAGSFYQHEEEYLSPQGTQYWRGILVKHEVADGSYNLLEVSMDYLQRTYGRKNGR